MPGFDRTGPMGAGPMTGGAKGFCRPANTGYSSRIMGESGYFGGFGARRGFRSGFGAGRGQRRNFSRGSAWYGPVLRPEFPAAQATEMDMLKAEADYLRSSLETIEKRIANLETDTSA